MNDLSTQIWEQISKAKHILLHCHPNTDGDSVGSALAMYHVLKNLGKKPTVIAGDNDPLPSFLSFLPGFKEIVSKGFGNINLKDFDLFIILDSPHQNRITQKTRVHFPLSIPTINIDHHVSNPKYADLNLVDPISPATGQILYELFKEWGIAIDHDTAACLFVGIYTDTFGFRYEGTTKRTFLAGAELSEIAPEFPQYIFTLYNSHNPGWIAYIGLAFSNLQHWFGGNVVVSTVLHKDILAKKITEDELGGVGSTAGSMLQSVVGWNISVMCTEEKPGKIKISFRSRDSKRFDVSKLSIALGGGGHPAASGTKMEGNIDDVLAKIKQEIGHIYPELANKP